MPKQIKGRGWITPTLAAIVRTSHHTTANTTTPALARTHYGRARDERKPSTAQHLATQCRTAAGWDGIRPRKESRAVGPQGDQKRERGAGVVQFAATEWQSMPKQPTTKTIARTAQRWEQRTRQPSAELRDARCDNTTAAQQHRPCRPDRVRAHTNRTKSAQTLRSARFRSDVGNESRRPQTQTPTRGSDLELNQEAI